MNKHSKIQRIIFCPLIWLVLAGPVFAVDLLETYREALKNDPIYASARASLAAGQEKTVQGRSLLLPQVNLTGTNTLTLADFTAGDQSVNGRTTSNAYAIQLTQPLFRWGNWQQYEQGKLQTLASEAQFGQAKLDLIVRVAQAYFNVLSAQDVLESVLANKKAIAEQLEFAKRNFEVGTATITDQYEAQARYDLALAQEFAAESDLAIQRATLRTIVGFAPDGLTPLDPQVHLTPPEPADITEWVESAEHNNYSVVNAGVTREIAKRAISLNRAGHMPTLDLVASVNRTRTPSISVDQQPDVIEKSRNIGIQLNVPIFSGFAVTSQVREAIALEDKASNDLESARRNAALAARQAFAGVNSGLAQVNAFQSAVVSSQSALEANMVGYELGTRINIDVLNAQQQLYTTRQNLAKARYDTIMNGLRLKQAAASLSEDDIEQVNRLLH